jgi:hypothetical protein
MLTPPLLTAFLHTFYGYGNWKAYYWFVGMEEGGGNDLEQVKQRLDAWDQRGRRDLEDLHNYHAAINIPLHSGEKPKLQSTWSRLVRTVLAAKGQNIDTDAVRRYQGEHLGTADGETALLELLPLPSPSTSHWLYGTTGIEMLRDRQTYRTAMLPERTKYLRERIAQFRPMAVIFYGAAYRDIWRMISGVDEFAQDEEQRFEFAKKGGTLMILAKHPVARGKRNADFEAIGRLIAATSFQPTSSITTPRK